MVLVDGHVHVHECFDVARVFDAAAANFAAAARALAGDRDSATAPGNRSLRCSTSGIPALACVALPRASLPAYDAVLCLVESRGERFLDGVRARRTGRVWRGRHGFWEAERGCEAETLVVRRGSTRLTLIAGRQLVTQERLEVLALGTTARLADGEPIETTLAAVRDSGAAAVLPWGVGKWLGTRGAVVARVLADPEWQHVFLGDNGNRLELGPDPAPFTAARRGGRAVLPGSDPLPLPGEEARVGGYGFAVDVALDPLRPAAALLSLLRSGAAFVVFGRREPLSRFVGNQLALKLKSRPRRPTSHR
jgi:hypothetical protein